MRLDFYKKIIVGSVLTSLIFSPGLFSIQKTNAQVGITETYESPLSPMAIDIAAINISSGATAAKGVHDTTVNWTDRLLKYAGQALKKFVLDRLVNAATEWIKRGGFEGKGGPIVADWGAFFQQAGEDAVGLIAQNELPWLCAPLKLNVALSFFQPAQFSTGAACTLNTIVSDIDNLFKDFNKESKGRWITYNTLWEPQNNFFGTAIATEDHRELTLADTLKAKSIDATINLGYKSQQQCTINAETGEQTCRTLTPGNQIAQAAWDTSTNQKKVAGIISADDAAGYIGALLDAVIYRYGLLAMNGIAGSLGYNDSDNTSTAYADYQAAAFSSINSIIFKNDKTLFTQTFNTILGIKRNILLTINQSINSETLLRDQLTALQQKCNFNAAFPNGKTVQVSNLIAGLSDKISNSIQPILDGLTAEKDPVQNDIAIIQNTQNQFNAMNAQDSASENLMVKTYNNLLANGTLDAQAANQALSDDRAELASIQTGVKNDLNTPSTTIDPNTGATIIGGYQDIIAACASVTP